MFYLVHPADTTADQVGLVSDQFALAGSRVARRQLYERAYVLIANEI